MASKVETCRKIPSVLIDVTVEVEFPNALPWWRGCTVEDRARVIKDRVDEFEKFLRDHRSQDDASFFICRIVQDQCSACGGEWEVFTEDGGEPYCAHCGLGVSDA